MGKTLAELGAREVPDTGAFACKESVFPFSKFPGVDIVLGPEMRSTGEVMGIDSSFGIAYAKAQLASGTVLPTSGAVFISVRDTDQTAVVPIARALTRMGFTLVTTSGTGANLRENGLDPQILQKIATGARPNVLDLMRDGKIQLVINTPTKSGWQTDEGKIRSSAVRLGVPIITTMTAAAACVRAIEALRGGDWSVAAIQDYERLARARALPAEPTVLAGPVAAVRR
jgi:carbamoyl-phosphate synthase large subunit